METYKEFISRKNEEFKKTAPSPFKDIGRKGSHRYIREAWTFMVQQNLESKVFCIERLKRIELIGQISSPNDKVGDIEYRIGYYIVGEHGRAKDKWVWGQFCPLIPQSDLKKLLNKAKQEGTII